MIKDEVFVVGIGLGGENVAYGLQQRNYKSYLINGSKQDNKTLPNAKNVLLLAGYDGLAGDRGLAFEALKNNKDIIKKISAIEEKVIFLVATGGGTTGSGSITLIANIASTLPNKIVCAALMMPRADEPIQKRLNAYNAAKELMEIPEMGAIMLVNNEYSKELDKINYNLVNMLDAFFTDDSSSATSNFDDSEKLKMLSDHGAFIISMRSDSKASIQEPDKKVSTLEMVSSLTAKNIFLPINNDGIVTHIGIINQRGNRIDEQEIIKAVGTPENIFIGNNGTANIVCASGLGFPVEYISNLGKTAMKEQKERMERRKAFSILDDLEEIENEPKVPEKREVNKRRQVSLDLLRELD